MIYYIGDSAYDSEYLAHYRISIAAGGAPNGKRQFQNYDGSLTPLGRKRYGVGPPRAKGDSSEKKKRSVAERLFGRKGTPKQTKQKEQPKPQNEQPTPQNEEEKARRDTIRKENQLPQKVDKSWTTDELKKKIERAELEKKYTDLVTPKPKELSEGKKFALNLLKDVAKTALVTYINNQNNQNQQKNQNSQNNQNQQKKKKQNNGTGG